MCLLFTHRGEDKTDESSFVLLDLSFSGYRYLGHAFTSKNSLLAEYGKSLVADISIFYTGLFKNKNI